ncbi:MAG: hypothetical protein A2X86_07290 [Bdellovibrionales bacterium GWA2_49_15]|nr:MAG: hypothetical protein A2X86_07290 [Bdellovibrionales bacterium GWA2_49_15]HAZ11919.1 hypothetical protein [Bdellovibrionales bacterium]
MNLSLRGRVVLSFIVANIVVLVLSGTVFHFLNSLNKGIEVITVSSNRATLLTDEIRISAVTILKKQREILSAGPSPERVSKIVTLCESFISQLNSLDALYHDAEVQRIVAQMISYVDSLKLVLNKAAFYGRDNVGMSSIADLADKILDSFSELQDAQLGKAIERDKSIKKIINETKRNMMITLIIGFLGTIVLGLVVPTKIALPFKKIKDAIRELQDCNFDVSIYYNQDDEIGELAREMNKMIRSFKTFDDLRADRVAIELRKFDSLANLVKKPILIADAAGKLMYMNNWLYSLLKVQSEDVIGKLMQETVIPASITETYDLAIKRRSKIENAEIIIKSRPTEEIIEVAEGDVSKGVESHEEEVVYKGFANVIPIRGKESSLDYYLMVVSTEAFI